MAADRELIQTLLELWTRERAASARAAAERRAETTLRDRVARGDALRSVEVRDARPVVGGRVALWLPHDTDTRIRAGDPLRLWWGDSPEGPDSLRAVAGRARSGGLEVVVDGEAPERLLTGAFHVDRDDPQATFDRGDRALRVFWEAGPETEAGRLRPVLFGERLPAFDLPRDWRPLDQALNGAQRAAVAYALCAEEVALIHGPPGTGKTRTLVELIRQAAARGESVLACAMSNTAVDHLAAGLVNAGLRVVRLGHPARVSPALEDQSIDRLVEHTEAYKLARQWSADARALRARARSRRERGSIGRDEARGMFDEARRLDADARAQMERAQTVILDRADVVCAGSDADLLAGRRYPLVVIDEATQAPDPVALVAAKRARRLVLAGDHEQLPPTLLSEPAARLGLGITMFERLVERAPQAVRMLTVQYRMSLELQAFASETRYGGKLLPDESVAHHRLEELGVRPDPERAASLVLVDTAGKGWDDRKDDDGSSYNPGQAERTVAEVRRLLSRGLRASDLAVITPYAAQRARLAAMLPAGVEVGTVDGFQGREKEAVVVDLVRSNSEGEVGFVADRRRLNVAFTRARRFMLVVADTATLGQHPDFAAFLEVVERHGGWVSAWSDEAEPLPEAP